MLLGTLSAASYAKPFISELERDFRPVIIPADPSHALRANLVTPSVPRPAKSPRHKLNNNDDALLHSVTNSRSGSKSTTADGSLHRSGNASSLSGLGVIKPKTQANKVSNAPWMRRMSYDEYARSGTSRVPVSAKKNTKTIIQQEKEMLNDPKLKEHRRKQVLSTFPKSRKAPVHPDLRKGHLKPVHIAPVFPDFASLGNDFIAIDFDIDEALTVENRGKEDPAGAEESVRSMATVSLAENTARRDEKPKKFIACYTPTDHTLDKRKRKREAEGDDDEEMEVKVEDTKMPQQKKKKIHFVENESYTWIGEYSIRESKFGAENGRMPVMARSCFAVIEHPAKNGKKPVACFTRINTNWKLSRRPLHEGLRLGKEGLQIARDLEGSNSRRKGEVVKKHLVSGKGRNVSNSSKKGKAMAELLEED